jgi:DNA-binding CsgD family transcriptional regulator
MNTRWNEEEKRKLIDLYSKKKSFEEIGKILKRSPNAVKLRIEDIVYSNLEKGKSPKSIAKILNIDLEIVKQHYYSHKSFRQNKGQDVIDIKFNNIKENNNSKIEYENHILNEILKNYKMKKEVKKLYEANKLNALHKQLYEKILKN